MTQVALRLLGDGDTPERSLAIDAEGDLTVGDEFRFDGAWRIVAEVEAGPDGPVRVVRTAIPIGAFHVGDKYVAEVYREEVRTLLSRARRDLSNTTPPIEARAELVAALEALAAGNPTTRLSDEALSELGWLIHALRVEDVTLTPGTEWLRVQIHRYFDDQTTA